MGGAVIYIGIDLGTSGVRAIAIDNTETIIAQAAVSLPPPQVDGPRIEQEPEIWWTAVCDCLATLTSQIDPNAVLAIAVDGTSASLLPIDKEGSPLGPALMYNDARAVTQAETIASIAPTDTAAQGASCTLAKLLWLKKHNTLEQANAVMHQADWIAARLRGDNKAVTDTNNAMKLGYDAAAQSWPQWLLGLLASHNIPQNLLPEVALPGTTTGTLSLANATLLGLPASTRIVAGTTDSTASFLATGASDVGEAVTVLGSTLVVKVIADQPVFSPEHGVYSQPLFIDSSIRWLVGGASNSGGAVLLQFFSYEQLQTMTPRLTPDTATGLDYYPLAAVGERFPVSDPKLKPRLMPRPDDDVVFLQGMLEGIARIEAQAYHLLAELGAPYPDTVRTTGGGAQNEAWTRIRQRALNSKMLTARNTHAAFGSALLAEKSAKYF